MDGNGRWANEQGLPRVFGHQQGAVNVRKIVEEAKSQGVETLSLFAFSSENWSRPDSEVDALMALIHRYIEQDKEVLFKNDIRLQAIGNLGRLPEQTRKVIEEAQIYLSHCQSMTLVVALSYGGREEIVDVCRQLAQKVSEGSLSPNDIKEELFNQHTYTFGLPDPDLLIRTSGELRISNYYLWQCAYTELYFSKKYWPAFSETDFKEAIQAYYARARRFGTVQGSDTCSSLERHKRQDSAQNSKNQTLNSDEIAFKSLSSSLSTGLMPSP